MINFQKRAFILLIITTISIIVLSIFLTDYYRKKSTELFEIFYAKEIKSQLKSFTSSASGVNLVLENNLEYKFRTRTSIEENMIFSFVARPNDLIEKRAFSDTLILTSKNKIYHFVCYYDGQIDN